MLITLGILAVAIVVIAVIGSIAGGGKKSLPAVQTIPVTKGNVKQEVDATGTIESEQKKTFFSPVNGEIQIMPVEVGDSVQAGQDIIRFDLENLESENQKAELNVKSGQLDLQDAQQQAGDAQAARAEAAAKVPDLEAQIQEKQEQITSLQQQIQAAQANAAADAQAQLEQAQARAEQEYEKAVADAQEKYNKEKEEYDTKTKPDYEKKLADLKALIDSGNAPASTQTEYEHALNNPPAEPVMEQVDPSDYAVSGEGIDASADTSDLQYQMESASSELAQLQSELASQKAIAEAETGGLTDAAQEKMRISNNLAELEAKNLQELLEEGRKGIQAEFTGVISDAQVKQGATVSQGMELFTLQSTEQVCVDANISKYDFDKVKEGQKATVTLGDKEYQGTVRQISKIAITNEKGTPLIGVDVHIDNPDEGIFIGVEAKVSIQAAEAEDVPILPVEAVNIGKDGSFCYVVKDGKIAKQDVETGVTSDSYVEIKKGLKAGDQVIEDIGNHDVGDAVRAEESREE